EWVHVQLHQQKGMISLSPPTICNSATTFIIKSDVVPALRAGAAALFSYEGGYSAVFVWCFLFLMFFCCGFRTVRFGARALAWEVLLFLVLMALQLCAMP
ncbi:hypothetical protein MZD82_24860, partial [Escherichia coli]|nr:hypothetical protein [Escherichia coli]